MSLCLASPLLAIGMGLAAFELRWAHSVERTEWRESWRVVGTELELVQAQVRGSGAGMEPPDNARLVDSWWVYTAALRVPQLNLAVSGATGRGWQLCWTLGCLDLESALSVGGQRPDSLTIRAATPCRPR